MRKRVGWNRLNLEVSKLIPISEFKVRCSSALVPGFCFSNNQSPSEPNHFNADNTPKLGGKAKVSNCGTAPSFAWENGADFDPSILHDWPRHESAWRAWPAKWRTRIETIVKYEDGTPLDPLTSLTSILFPTSISLCL
jgi:hypothetical protein